MSHFFSVFGMGVVNPRNCAAKRRKGHKEKQRIIQPPNKPSSIMRQPPLFWRWFAQFFISSPRSCQLPTVLLSDHTDTTILS